jgi:CO/xanthine dehydrogenase Mo-binding subunit
MAVDIVGSSVVRIDGKEKVTGKSIYSGDIVMPGMLHMKILFAGRPHARVLSIDTTQAEKVAGVVAVYIDKDVPVNEYGLQINDQPVLCGPNETMPGANVVRFVGDQVALVVAETEQIAEHARNLIKVVYEDLPLLVDAEEGLKPGAVILHPHRGDTNICVWDKIRKGDVEEGFANSDVIVEDTYRVPVQEHVYLQPEAGIAYMEDGVVTVKAAGQWTHADQKQIAHSLGLELEKVRVIYPVIGGAFGGREDMSVQIVLAMAAMKLNRPVKIVWTRKESMFGHGKRHQMVIKAKWGATKAGKLTAVETTFIADGGAYMYTSNKVLGNATITQSGPYYIPHFKSDVIGVYTNNVPGAAFRGFGAPQAAFMAELQMDKLAEKLGLDKVEFRLMNTLKPGQTLNVQSAPPGPISIDKVIVEAVTRTDWALVDGKYARQGKFNHLNTATKKVGVGMAAGFKNIGFSFGYKENCWARVQITGNGSIEEVTVWISSAEVGQGNHTILAQMAAQVIGVPFEIVKMITMDTYDMGNAGSASASRLTFMSGNAVKGASELAKSKWDKEDRPATAEYTYLAPHTTPFEKETGKCEPNFAYAYVAQACEVEVDIETGEITVLNMISANDVGKAINPNLLVGQIEGGAVQAQGYVLMENYITKDGYVLTDKLSTYLIPTVRDIPKKMEAVIVEVPDDRGPFGARGVGELPYLPYAPAIISAVHDATGVWINQFPLTPEVVLKHLGKI